MPNLPLSLYSETILSVAEGKLSTLPRALASRVQFLIVPCVDPRIQFLSNGNLTTFPMLGAMIPPCNGQSELAENLGTAMLVNPNARNVLIMGHNDCKAIEFLLKCLRHNITPPAPLLSRFTRMFAQKDNYFDELGQALVDSRDRDTYIQDWRSLTDWVTLASTKNYLNYPAGAQGETVAELIDNDNADTINIVPAFNNLTTGEIEILDPPSKNFVSPDKLTNTWREKVAGNNQPRSAHMLNVLGQAQSHIIQQIRTGEYSHPEHSVPLLVR